jgi:hypothetical protein
MSMGGNVYGPGNSKQVLASVQRIRSIQLHPLDGAVIQHRQVDLFLTTRGMDIIRQMFGGDPRVHRPERVNQKIDHFNATLTEIRNNKDALNSLLPRQKEQFEKRIMVLFDQFDSSVDQAVADYGKGIPSINKNEFRRRGEESIDLINQELTKISEDLQKGKDIWGPINKALENMRAYSQLSELENQNIQKQVMRAKNAYNEVLTNSGKHQRQGLVSVQQMLMFEQSAHSLKWTLDRLQEKIKKDLTEMAKEVRKGTDNLACITQALENIRTSRSHLSEFESQRLSQQLKKQADLAERAYNEVLANSGKRQNQEQLKSGTQQLKDIADSLKQTQVKLERGWIESIGRRVKASSSWFNANSYIPEGADQLALAAIKKKYILLSNSVENAEATIIEYEENTRFNEIQKYNRCAGILEDLESAFVKLAFPVKFREIHGIIEQMASLDTTNYVEIPVKGIGPSNQITEVLRESYARLHDAARTSILEALRTDISYAALTRAQHSVNRVETAQKGFQQITQIAKQMQEILDTISHLESQARTIGPGNQTAARLRATYSTLYSEARTSIVKAVQAGVSKEALTEAQAAVVKLQRQLRIWDSALDQPGRGKNLRQTRRYAKRR